MIDLERDFYMANYNNSSEIGINIRLIRKNMGLTMEEFGKKLEPNATKSNVSKWEKGVCVPNNHRLKEIAELGNTTVNDLIANSGVFIPAFVANSLSANISMAEYERLKEIERKYRKLKKGLSI